MGDLTNVDWATEGINYNLDGTIGKEMLPLI